MDWVEDRSDLQVKFGSGSKDGSFQAGYSESWRYFWPFVMYTYGRVELQFVHIAKRPPFHNEALRNELRERLAAIPGVTLPPVVAAQRPSLDLAVLIPGDAFAIFTQTMDWAFAEANRTSAAIWMR